MENNHITIICKTTNCCNANCFYCFDKISQGKYTTYIPENIVLEFFNKLVTWCQDIEWIWHGGEPLLYDLKTLEKLMFKMKQLSYKYNIVLKFGIQTNGIAFNDEISDLLDKYHVSFGMSYDGITNYRSRGYEPNYKALNSARGYITVINKYNVDNLYEMYYGLNRNDKYTNFNFVFGENLSELLGDINHAINQYAQYAIKYIDDSQAHITQGDRNLHDLICMTFGWKTSCCEAGDCFNSRIFCLNTNGDIFKCDETMIEDFKLGHYTEFNSYDELLTCEKYQILHDKFIQLGSTCIDCELHSVCQCGCPIQAYKESRMSRPYSFNCALRKKLIPIIFNKLYNLTPEEFVKINPMVKKILIEHQYLPFYKLEQIGERLGIYDKNDSNS